MRRASRVSRRASEVTRSANGVTRWVSEVNRRASGITRMAIRTTFSFNEDLLSLIQEYWPTRKSHDRLNFDHSSVRSCTLE